METQPEEQEGQGGVVAINHQDIAAELQILPVVNNSVGIAASMTFEDANKSWDMLQFHRKARDNEKYCDAVLHVHGRQFLCHRLILAANSPYFDSIFQSRIANSAAAGKSARNSQYYSKNGANNISQVVMMESLIIGCTEPEVFQTFLNFMYTGNVTVDKGNVAELLRLANNFMVGKLKEYCSQFLERFIDVENCIQVKEVGERYGIQSLVKCATQFVQKNLEAVINHDIMMELLPKQVESFVMDKGFQIPHDVALKFMSRWVCHDIPNRERDYKPMLTNIEWSTMTHEFILAYIDQEPLFGHSERSFFYILQSLSDRNIHVEKYNEIFQALQQRFAHESDHPLGYGDNLLQMAFNSAMEGLQVPTDSSWAEGKEKRPGDENEQKEDLKPKKLTLEQRRRRILRKIHRNRMMKRWVVVRLDKPKPKALAFNEMAADSSGDEECELGGNINSSGYQCHMCPFTAKKISRLERHLACIHAHDVTYRCSECGYTCKWNRDYFLHMKGHYDGPPYKCNNCDFTGNKIGSLIAHRVSHLDIKPYHCTECEFKSRSKANLAAHVKIHNNEKPYRCGICGRNFGSKNSLDQHAVGHNTDKTYSCTQCPFSTKYLNHFTNHKKTHHTQGGKKGKELYRCTDPQCKYTTSKKSQLESHQRSHAGVRPHVCGICGRRFLEKSHLVRHERIHFNERPFKCEECDYASTRRDKLKEHKHRHHGANASAKSPYKPRPHKGKASSGSTTTASDSTGTTNSVVYAKKSTASNSPTSSTVQTAQQQELQGTMIASQGQGTSEMEFMTIPGIATTTDGVQIQMPASGSIDLQQITAGGLVQLRPYQPVTSCTVTVPSQNLSSNSAVLTSAPPPQSTHAVQIHGLLPSPTSTSVLTPSPHQQSSDAKKVTKPHRSFILVQQGKSSDMQVSQTLTFPGTATAISSQDLQRTLGIKLEDLQAQANLVGIQTAGGTTARAIKLEDLQNLAALQGTRVQGGTTMVLDASQLQQLQGFDRIPITVAQIPSSSAGATVQVQTSQSTQVTPTQQQGPANNQQSAGGSTGNNATNQADFSGLNLLNY